MTRQASRAPLLGSRRGSAVAVVVAAALAVVAAAAVLRLAPPDRPVATVAPPARSAAPAVQALAAFVMDPATGEVLYAKQPDRRLPIASLTKIMTAMLVLEREPDLDRVVTVPATALDVGGAGLGLRLGDRISIRELLLGLMVRSATDCAVTLATAVSGDEPRFARLMNRRSSRLGLTNTHFVNSSGLNVPGHYSSARDLSLLGREAMKDNRFRSLARRVRATVTWEPSRRNEVHSHNRFNELYDWVDGIKTGATAGTGACMVATGKYDGRRLIVTTLREPSRAQEVRDALTLFEYGASRLAHDDAAATPAPTVAGSPLPAL